MRSSQNFWDKIARKYAAQPIKDEKSYQKKLEITRSYMKPDMHLLEIGCGTGSTAIKHAPHVAAVRAVDISENMLDIAREHAAEAGVSNIMFERNAIEDMELQPESYDMALALSILHLLEDWQSAIRRIFDALKPGGLFITSTVCIKDGFGLLGHMIPVMRFFGLAPFVAQFSAKDLESDFKAAGFDIEINSKPGHKGVAFMVLKKPQN